MTLPNDDENSALVNIFAKFGLSIDRLAAKVDRANRIEQARLAMLPNSIAFSRLSLLPAGGVDIVDFGGPQPGRSWIVRLLTALPSPLGGNSSVVVWYVGQNVPGPATGQLPATMARWQFVTVPAFQSFTSDVIKVKPNERLIAAVSGAPANSSLALTAAVNDQPEYSGSPVITE